MPLARTHVLSSSPAYPAAHWTSHSGIFQASHNQQVQDWNHNHQLTSLSLPIFSWFNHAAVVPLLTFISSHLNCCFSYTPCTPASALRVILHAVTLIFLKSKYDFILSPTYNPSKASWWLLLHPMSLKTWVLPTSYVSSQAYLIPAMPSCLEPHELSWVTFTTCYSTCPRCPFLIPLTELTPAHLPKLRAGVSQHRLKT